MTEAQIWALMSMSFIAVMFFIAAWSSRFEDGRILERQLEWLRERQDGVSARLGRLEGEKQ